MQTMTNEDILALKVRIALCRERLLLRMTSLYTERIRNATTLEDAQFFNDILINEVCGIDTNPELKELIAELPDCT